MTELKDFFSSKHKQLLNIAMWAKYLAWIVLALYVLDLVSRFFQREAMYAQAGMLSGASIGFVSFLAKNPVYGLNFLLDELSLLFNGIVYFLVLRGIALGLNMIVETDINYREQKGDEQ